jgi:hypothetical protein
LTESFNRLTLNGNFDGTGVQSILVNNTIGGGDGFLGIVGTAKFDSVYFGNDLTTVDGFSIDNASIASTPEPSAVVAIALVGGSLFWSKRMKQKKSLIFGTKAFACPEFFNPAQYTQYSFAFLCLQIGRIM